METTTNVQLYKVVKIGRISIRRQILRRGLTRDEAISMVNRYADNSRSMVVFDKQFTSDKYFK